jgi:hypothetical protein
MRETLDFLLTEWLDHASLLARPRFADHSVETFSGAGHLRAHRRRKVRALQPPGRHRRSRASTASACTCRPPRKRR